MLAYEILSRTTYSKRLEDPAIFSGNDNDRNIGIDRLIAQGIFEACYPIHEVKDNSCYFNYNIDIFKDYGFVEEKKTNRQVIDIFFLVLKK